MPQTNPNIALSPERIPKPAETTADGIKHREQPVTVERAVETATERIEHTAAYDSVTGTIGQVPVSKSNSAVSLQDIEQVLSTDLEEVYVQLPPALQVSFKQQGETLAKEIKTLLEKTRINVKKIAVLIMRWLALIPGVNKFFLEQESKIKTDEVLKLKVNK